MKRIVFILFWCSILFFSYLLLLITLQYVPIRFDVAFLVTKSEVLKHSFYKIAFYTHVYTALFTVLLGFPLFSTYIRKNYTHIHRILGKVYVFVVLFLAGSSGLVMSFFANGGIFSVLSFVLLSILWLVFTYKAYSYARQKKFILHKAYMYRSYALTLSAISLRLFKWILANTVALPPMDMYVIVAWLSWTVNLAITEYLILKNRG